MNEQNEGNGMECEQHEGDNEDEVRAFRPSLAISTLRR